MSHKPNLLVCKSCAHEWKHRGHQACPECESGQVEVRCGRKKTTDGKPCRRWPKNGHTACGRHGAQAARGPKSPVWKGGVSLVDYAPKRYKESLRRALLDPRTLELADDLAMMRLRMEELFAQAEEAVDFAALRKAWREYQVAEKGKREVWAKVIDDIIAEGAALERAWDEIGNVVGRRAQLVRARADQSRALGNSLDALTLEACLRLVVEKLRPMIPKAKRAEAAKIVEDVLGGGAGL